MKPIALALLGAAALIAVGATFLNSQQVARNSKGSVSAIPGKEGMKLDYHDKAKAKGHELALFAAGCFWGVEADFRQIPGVIATAVGFTGGDVPNVSYQQVCEGDTGHAEAVLVEYDPKKVNYEFLVRVFFENHDPTTVNRQGPDFGAQYRSEIFYFGDEQKKIALKVKDDLEAKKKFSNPIVTLFAEAGPFYKAEDYHQQYYEKKGIFHNACRIPTGTTGGGG